MPNTADGPYTVCSTSKDTTPCLYGVNGPGRGLGFYAWYLFPENTFSSTEEAEKVARLMNLAFAEGQKAARAEIRRVLGSTMVYETPRAGDWMQTYTGRQFWPIDPRPEDIDIVDIAHALSMMCRYNGHCQEFYSVAEHSVLVSESVPEEDALWGLLHDAPEAYIADIIRPAKPYIQGYKAVEARLMTAVCHRFDLPFEQPRSVTYVDYAICADELAQIMGPQPRPWNLPHPPLGVEIKGWGPAQARRAFLKRFMELTQ